jgi:CheY-like chemotaxis protein
VRDRDFAARLAAQSGDLRTHDAVARFPGECRGGRRGSGAEAVGILARDGSIDVLFTDVVMPGMAGGEVAAQAKRFRPDMRIL